MNTTPTLSIWTARLLAVVFATVATLVFYKGYGRADQIEQLPIILRALDSGFLTQDFFTNVTEGAIARLHYSKLLAALIQLTGSLPLLFLLITWISNIAIALISFGITRDLFGGSARAGLFAVALVMAAYTFSLGWISVGSMWMLTPTTLVLPFVLAAVWALIKNSIVLAVSLCVVASAIHPLLGLEVGGILLFVDVVRRFILARSIHGRQLAIWGICALLLGAAAYVLVYPQLTQEKIASPDFIYILATFRHPHHYVPSTFGWMEYAAAAVFLIVAAQAFLQWEARHQNPEASIAVKVLATILLGLCLPGYLLVEVWPVRLVTTAQLFRILYVVKWLGLIFLAGKMANARNWNSIVQYAGAMHPFALGLGSWSGPWWSQRVTSGSIVSKLVPLLVIALMIAMTLYVQSLLLNILVLASFGAVLFLYKFFSERLLRVLSLSALLLAAVFVAREGRIPFPGKDLVHAQIGSEITPELPPAALEVAAFAKAHSPEDAIFLTPPAWGQFRLLAHRAIVVDFKAFPFTDRSMEAWYKRMGDCYGQPSGAGFQALPGFDANYRKISDQQLLELKERYGAGFAVLYLETPSQFPLVFENHTYKVVNIQ